MCSRREIIAVNQDKLGKQGKRIAKVSTTECFKLNIINITPEKFETAILFLRLGLPT